jgi:hypothetical protein
MGLRHFRKNPTDANAVLLAVNDFEVC